MEILEREGNNRGGENCVGAECILEVKPIGLANKLMQVSEKEGIKDDSKIRATRRMEMPRWRQ